LYWIRTSQVVALILLSLQFLLIAVGGWVTATHAFRLPSKQRIPVGISLGLILFIFFSNILGRWIPPEWSFWISVVCVVLVGGLTWFINKDQFLNPRDLKVWPQLLMLGVAILLFTLIGRGLGIFDDRKNLSLISLMAAGDIPPHFYMNSEFFFSYHYGFQLLGASLMRIGGLFPWSAFDLSKGIVAGLAILMSFVWGRKVSRSHWGGVIFAFLILFASGTRWLLLLFPPSLVLKASQGLTLWGSGAQSTQTLLQGLSSIWVVEGGPPTPIPFAFTNGILQPFILHLQAGPRSLALVIFFTLSLIIGRRRNLVSTIIVIIVLSTWALTAEAEFALFAAGIGILTLFLLILRVDRKKLEVARDLIGIVFVAGLFSLIQGGTITEIAKGLLPRSGGAALLGTIGPDVGFGLRFPPAIVSSHLGEMRILHPGELVIALAEIGPLLLLAPVAAWFARKRILKRDYFSGAFGVSTILGFLLPVFIYYSVDRDVTRMTQYALVGWLILGWPVIVVSWKLNQAWWRSLLTGFGFLTVFGGLVVSGPLLSALHTVVFADGIAPVDAVMLRSNWDTLEPGSEVLDSDPWRAVALTGRLTRSSASSYATLPEWECLRSGPSLDRVVSAGFEYIYIDTYWWNSMTEEGRNSYSSPCVELFDEASDNAENGRRWLYDLRSCK
jgi:hypothetical protein